MGYLEEFQVQLDNRDFQKFLQLWEEYCTSDHVDAEEFIQLLKAIKRSELARTFGQFVETALPLWQTIQDRQSSYDVLKLLMDLQTTNSVILADHAFEMLKEFHASSPEFNERIRLIGLRSRDNFQGAIANYDLLAHMKSGKFVYHTGGWGTGEIIDFSPIREQVGIEFENVSGRKYLTFANAFKTLIPLSDDHFLARRFANPDLLEQEAKEHPISIIKILLRDLGPKSAAEIKDELCELVIPEKDWTKWWQAARAKIKKDTMIETPTTIRDCFHLRKAEVTHEERLQKSIQHKTGVDEIILTSYNFVRDMPNMLKKPDVKSALKETLLGLLSNPLSIEQELQLAIFLDEQFGHQISGKHVEELIKNLEDIEAVIHRIEIVAFKKRVLVLIRKHRSDWTKIFLNMFITIQPNLLRDYILKELCQEEHRKLLIAKLKELLKTPSKDPETFVWYFQKIASKGKGDIPFHDKEGQCLFFESFLILLNYVESKPEYRDLTKKMYNLISGKRYAIVRAIIEGTSIEFIKEFMLLVSKCHTFSDHDLKILRSLAEVVHPSLASPKKHKGKEQDSHIIWTTEEGYFKIQDRIKQIGTIEIIENAREVEAARALGDLRENSEYKFALEKRARLQGELKTLSEQFGRARIITKDDIPTNEVDIGTIVDVEDSKGNKSSYTILGPWDADADNHVLSLQSKLAQSMVGCKKGDRFQFRDDEYTIVKIKSFLDK